MACILVHYIHSLSDTELSTKKFAHQDLHLNFLYDLHVMLYCISRNITER